MLENYKKFPKFDPRKISRHTVNFLVLLNHISCYSPAGSAAPSFKACRLVIIVFTVGIISSFHITALRIIFIGPVSHPDQLMQCLEYTEVSSCYPRY